MRLSLFSKISGFQGIFIWPGGNHGLCNRKTNPPRLSLRLTGRRRSKTLEKADFALVMRK
jgi:hypothetical protein